MSTTQTSRSLTIHPAATVHFTSSGRQRLSFGAGKGFVWLTRDGDIKDYWLRAGDAISLCAGDHVWLTLEHADEAASLTLEPLDGPRPLWRSVAALFSGHPARPCRPAVESHASGGPQPAL